MFFMFDHCWKGFKSFINIFCLHDFFSFFSNVILALDEVISLGDWRSFFNCVSVPFKYFMKNFVDSNSFLIEVLFVQFVLVVHRSLNNCCDPCFSKRICKPSFNNPICTTKLKMMYRLSFTKNISRLGPLLC